MNQNSMLIILIVSFVVCLISANSKAWGWFNFSLIILFLLCFWSGNQDHLMTKYDEKFTELETLFNRAIKSQHIPFMQEVAEILMQYGVEIHAEILHDEIHFLKEEIFEKSADTVSNRFNDIVQCDGGGWA